jgi:acyl-CoA thioester hydrolase
MEDTAALSAAKEEGMHRYALRVRYADTDQMGWAYYGHYFRWFEIGRTELLRSLGRSYSRIEREVGIRLPVREARCRYLRGARYDDPLVVETGVAGRSRVGVSFAYRIVPEAGGTPHAVGLTEHFFMDTAGRPVRPAPEVAELLERAPSAPEGLLAMIEGRKAGARDLRA